MSQITWAEGATISTMLACTVGAGGLRLQPAAKTAPRTRAATINLFSIGFSSAARAA